MREKTTLFEYIQSIVSQMTMEDANCEILGVGTGYHGDNNFYIVELKSGKKIEIPMYKN